MNDNIHDAIARLIRFFSTKPASARLFEDGETITAAWHVRWNDRAAIRAAANCPW